MDFQEWLSEHGAGVAIAALSLGVLATQLPSIQEGWARNQQTALENKDKLQENQKLEAEKLTRQAGQEIANSRYDEGCEVIEALQRPGVATTIQEGQPIVAGAFAPFYRQGGKLAGRPVKSSHVIGRDVVVCDLYGTTAVMKFDPTRRYAVASNIAVTSDRERMLKAKGATLERPSLVDQNIEIEKAEHPKRKAK